MRPGLPWIGFNLLRLTAVIFLVWALAAQFIALANDLSAYSKVSQDTTPSSASALSDSSSASSSTEAGALLTASGVAQWPSTSTQTGTAASATGITTVGHIGGGVSSQVSSGVAENSRSLEKRAEDAGGVSANVAEANWGLSSISRQSGGAAFAIISRIGMAFAVTVILLGQIGWPEMFLYRWIPWLGPKSTPVWLGLVEVIIAIENLRVYAKAAVLIPAWGMFAIGLVNFLLGCALIWLARNLPKSPPPPLYFNMSMRALFFTPLPACYNQLFKKPTPAPNPEDEKHELPLSNANEIGLDSDDEDEEKLVEGISTGRPAPPQSRPAAFGHGQRSAHQDIQQGGYPTFSGGGLTDPGRQVPTGFVERTKDGRPIRFIGENGEEVGRTGVQDVLPPLPVAASAPAPGSEVKREDLPPRNHSRRKPGQLNLPGGGRNPAAAPRRAGIPGGQEGPRRSGSTDSKDSSSQPEKSSLIKEAAANRRARPHQSVQDDPKLPPPEQKRQSSLSSIVAYQDLGHQFPVPPSHEPPMNGKPVKSPLSPKSLNIDTSVRMVKAIDKDAPSTPKSARSRQGKESRLPRPDLQLNKPSPRRLTTIDSAPSTAPISPAHSLTRASSQPPQRKRAATLNSFLADLPLRSSMANVSRTSSSRSSKSVRVARGVRFMDKVEEKSPSPPVTGVSSDVASEINVKLGDQGPKGGGVGGLRIPGTSYRVAIPGIHTPKGEAARPESWASSSSEDSSEEETSESESDDSEKGRVPASTARDAATGSSTRRVKDDKAGLPKASRPKTMAVLGGGYLDGGKERDERRRRQSSVSLDSRSSREM
ncbi:hypothetical protein IAT38_007746 [Cryptococcus sp. DSM 104549]